MAAPRPALWRITDRRTFRDLRQHGRRVRRGPLTLTWLPAPAGAADPARAAFLVDRRSGGAVVRNRIRRRLRAALRDLAGSGRLPAGAYLVGGGAELAELPWPALLDQIAGCLDEVGR